MKFISLHQIYINVKIILYYNQVGMILPILQSESIIITLILT